MLEAFVGMAQDPYYSPIWTVNQLSRVQQIFLPDLLKVLYEILDKPQETKFNDSFAEHSRFKIKIENQLNLLVQQTNKIRTIGPSSSPIRVQKVSEETLEPDMDDEGKLTYEGRQQILRGLRRCSNINVNYLGSDIYQEAGTGESQILLSGINWIRRKFQKRFKYDLQIRFLASYNVHLFLFLIATMLWIAVYIFTNIITVSDIDSEEY